ncbi:SDR family NAD(P)-dependent oxidoreductase [Limobrevibacterium gyesilva]|uniref:SDR family oxidoreductase n=1 Tax=Limobrevibacterium gyesilva TaxID=2991712 RepID=A0AA42CFH9_9PROT|nr:SDR family oxidoreductase [Limobrevibacterium gyesilva]
MTGGASGIGAAFVRAFAEQGARVGFLDRDSAAAEPLIDALARAGNPRPLFVACDLTDIEALKAAFATLYAGLGPAAVLVNNAANDRRQDFLAVDEAEFDWSMSVNFKHQYFAAQAVVPQMRELGFGSIINMSSGAWIGGGPSMQAYSAAKAAAVGFTNSLARDVGQWRIRVNAIAPGQVITPRQRALWFQDEAQIAAGRARQCIPDDVEPSHVAALALFLASDDAALITKQCFQVNGGAR